MPPDLGWGGSLWDCLTLRRVDDAGNVSPVGSPPAEFVGLTAGRPLIFLVHGNGYTDADAMEEGLRARCGLLAAGGFAPGSVFVIFDWPSDRVYATPVRDLNEKSRRARVAGEHLARFVQALPIGSQVCLLGHSYGGYVVLSALQLIAGGQIEAERQEPAMRLEGGRPDLRLRAVTVEAASSHHWLNPGERFEHALPACEAFLNVYNKFDKSLAVYILSRSTGVRPAIGRVGLRQNDLRKLGPQAARVRQIEVHDYFGSGHPTVGKLVAVPQFGAEVAVLTNFAPVSTP